MKKIILFIFVALVVTACGERIKPDQSTGASAAANTSEQQNVSEHAGAAAGSIDNGGMTGGTILKGGKRVSFEKGAISDPNNILSDRIIYFAFDSDKVPDKYIDLIQYHGKYLSLNPQAKMRLEGHTDERGSREYNIALGERRAQAVKQLMLYEGADPEQITVISYGEEKPAAFGHDEESMRLNRRVEIVYE